MSFNKSFLKTADVGIGVQLGGLAGTLYALHKAQQFVNDKIVGAKKKEDSKKLFSRMKKYIPEGTVLLTNSDLHKGVKNSKTVQEMQFWQTLRHATEGNAAAVPASATKGFLFELGQKLPTSMKIPEHPKGKNMIVSDDKVNPVAFAHEVGHIIDFDNAEKGGAPTKIKNFFSLPFREERAAWDLAPKDGLDPHEVDDTRKGALGTYYGSIGYPLGGALLGGASAALLGKVLAKRGAV